MKTIGRLSENENKREWESYFLIPMKWLKFVTQIDTNAALMQVCPPSPFFNRQKLAVLSSFAFRTGFGKCLSQLLRLRFLQENIEIDSVSLNCTLTDH